MQRKIIQIADSTQLVSLPRKWAKKYNLKKGEELFVETDGNCLTIKTEKGIELKSAEIDISGLDRTSILYYLEILYRMGYEEIKATFSNPEADHYREHSTQSIISIVHYVASRLIGMEVIQQRENFILLKSLNLPTNKEFDTIMKRVFMLLQDTSDDYIKGAEELNHRLLESIEEKHDSITKFISYAMRILNIHGTENNKNKCVLYHLLNQVDKLTDVIKYSSRDLRKVKNNLSKECIDLLKNIHISIRWYHQIFLKFDKSKIKDLYFNRDKIIKKVKLLSKRLDPMEIIIVEDSRQILEYLVDMTQARMGMEH